jgi:hypothetical protein
MCIRCLAVFVVCLLMPLQCSITKADYIVASNLPAAQTATNSWAEVGLISTADNYNNVAAGQSFTPTASGILTTIDALLSSAIDQPTPPDSPPLDISIYTALNSAPGTLLATVQKHSGDFPHLSGGGDHRSPIDFTQFQIPLLAGQHYFLEFETPIGVVGFLGPNAPYFVGRQQNPFPPFALGEFSSVAPNHTDWQIDSTAELAIAVHAVPEPTACFNLLTAMLIGCMMRRSTRTQPQPLK